MSTNHQAYKRRVYSACVLVVCAAVSICAWKVYSSCLERENLALEQSRSFVRAIEAHVSESLQLIDLSLIGFSNAIRLLPPGARLDPETISAILSSNGSRGRTDYWVLFLDAKGIGVAASNGLKVEGVDYSDRDYFRVHRAANAERKMYVGEPDLGRVSKKRIFFLSRRVESHDGKFLGVIAAPVEASLFANMFRNARFREDVSISLIHQGGKMIASAPLFEEYFANDVREHDANALADPQSSGTYRAYSNREKIERTVSYRMIDKLPLVVSVGVSPDGADKALLADLKVNSAAIFIVMLLTAGIGRFAISAADKVGRAREALLKVRQDIDHRVFRRTADLEEANLRLQGEVEERKEAGLRLALFEKCLSQLTDMVLITEAGPLMETGPRIIFVNDAFERQTGYVRQEMMGRTPRMLQGPRTSRAELDRVRAALERSEAVKTEVVNYRKDGSEYWVEMEIVAVKDAEGACSQFVSIQRDITERKLSEDLIWKQANIDALTGLPNRNMFIAHFGHEIKNAARNGTSLALMFLDLDSFKEVNDVYGHDVGDLLLQEAARRLKTCIRDCDFMGRIGGDEFTILLTGLSSYQGVERVAEEILGAMSRPFQLQEESIFVSASIGITLCPDDASAVSDLLKNADQAMYVAKSKGRNRFVYFDHQMQEEAQRRMRMAGDLRNALANGEFELHYQPIVNLKNGRIAKAEALIRWRHPQKGMISPATFIPLAEDTGTICGVGNWVFEEAVRTVVAWRSRYDPAFQISINASPVQFKNGGIPHARWLSLLDEMRVPGSSLVIEITERLLLDVEDSVKCQLYALRQAGMQMSLDDFGTGYSSLSYLTKLNIDYIKIDQSFVSSLTPDSDDMILCEAMIAMAHKLGLKVVAEGIETEAQCALLKGAGCDYGQGYLFSRPVDARTFEGLIVAHAAA
ncbi:bifunctional diguanylate cyclase/phosphodiesterase [Noviherbaspirillum galbum]|uniref:EAL domain-containing protein n=1 Tax=Noviherbaspirillum galbum TaxID=2709383 RepID=A0A6B3SS36_9BURK|nr:EAL domain-containing protein [Noviherbaspirillum galbum]NEX63750.1 EAL domain-containing protein [Noviherbaspirillum galbum]